MGVDGQAERIEPGDLVTDNLVNAVVIRRITIRKLGDAWIVNIVPGLEHSIIFCDNPRLRLLRKGEANGQG